MNSALFNSLLDTDEQLLGECLLAWGANEQLWQGVEEAAELIVAVCHLRREHNGLEEDRKRTISEMVDLKNMIDELVVLLNVTPEEYNTEFEFKRVRLIGRYETWKREHQK